MVKYGNTISLMDATYKTTKYELALFFVAVKTNVGYTAVADFVLQSETAEQIREAFQKQRLKPFKKLSLLVRFTFVIFTESKPGRDGSKIRSMVYLLTMEVPCLIFSEMWLSLLLQQIMINPLTITIASMCTT